MNLTEYKALIKSELQTNFPNLETQMGTTDFNRLVTGITRRPARWLLNELDARTPVGARYDEAVAVLQAAFGVDQD